jgi:hypothetical protein
MRTWGGGAGTAVCYDLGPRGCGLWSPAIALATMGQREARQVRVVYDVFVHAQPRTCPCVTWRARRACFRA